MESEKFTLVIVESLILQLKIFICISNYIKICLNNRLQESSISIQNKIIYLYIDYVIFVRIIFLNSNKNIITYSFCIINTNVCIRKNK